MIKAGGAIKGAKVLILGLTFKEDCPDMRNTKVIDIIEEIKEYEVEVDVYDPWVDVTEEKKYYHHGFVDNPLTSGETYDAIIIAVGHSQFKSLTEDDYKKMSKRVPITIDVKGIVANPTWRL
jgi:UDP-N-acetyl-D-galactosamine dehydrogenase